MLRSLFAFVMAFCLCVGFVLPSKSADSSKMRVEAVVIVTSTGKHVFEAEIADTGISRRRGLMFRSELAPNAGMLFDNRIDQQMHMWMKNTLISLDMIFVTKDGTIASVAKNAVPHSEADISSGVVVRGVFEVIAGTADRLNIQPGDRLEHPLFK